MRKQILSFVAGALCFTAVAFTASYEAKLNTAEVDQESGMAIFVRSKPVKEYEFLGKVNMPELVMTGSPEELMNKAIKRAKKQYPEANAIIFQSSALDKVDAVKIK